MSAQSQRRDPATDSEWELAAVGAAGLRLIADAQTYGLIAGGLEINVDRCDEILDAARERGIVPTQQEAEHAAVRYIAQVRLAEAGQAPGEVATSC